MAIQMRMHIGDWFRVIEMIKEGTGHDEQIKKAND